MTTNPDQIRAEIEQTRASLSQDVDALNQKVNPRFAVERGKNRVRDRFSDAATR